LNDSLNEVEQTGGFLVGGLFKYEIETRIKAAIPDPPCVQSHRRGGLRNPHSRHPSLLSVINSAKVNNLLGRGFRLVRSILFDKTAGANWAVPWHQDRTIAVREKRDLKGFGPWSIKEGIPHVQPPLPILEKMITLRVHLDDAGAENGALRIISESHRMGILDNETIARLGKTGVEKMFEAKAGDVLMMKPLVLHASHASADPSHRRVLHLEYSDQPLPNGLDWAEA
jgi:ectoine hydroxylase-related dioxygenase (phytanoyl-CoA dioxygenase family)